MHFKIEQQKLPSVKIDWKSINELIQRSLEEKKKKMLEAQEEGRKDIEFNKTI